MRGGGGDPESFDEDDPYDGSEYEESYPLKISDFDAASQSNKDITYNSTATESDDSAIAGGFHWLPVGNIPLPPTLSKRIHSYMRNEYTSYFDTLLSSFLLFVPLKILKSIAGYYNLHAHQAMKASVKNDISGALWTHNITLTEIYCFFGILYKMVLRPTSGKSYERCWEDALWHRYTNKMSLRRL